MSAWWRGRIADVYEGELEMHRTAAAWLIL